MCPAPASPGLKLPAPFGRYELLERIGQGGMADIFLARAFGAAGFEKKLVIKRIREEHAQDPRFVNLFIQEARIGVHLNHPNLASVYELGKVGEIWFIAMEWVNGPDLNRLLRALRARGERMPPAIAVRILAEALRGLGHAHGLPDVPDAPVGMIHRDISPHNVLVSTTGDVKLVDFGVAQLRLEADEPSASTPPGGARKVGGKQRYMSPEQARGAAVDARSDLYSAGMVLWELLTGERMYADLTPEARQEHLAAGTVQDPAQLGIELDPELCPIVRRALAPDPTDRYPHALAFEEDLRSWLYRQPTPIGRHDVAALVRDLFPQQASATRARHELHQLAADLKRLDGFAGASGGLTDPSHSQPPGSLAPPTGEERKRVAAMVLDVDGFTAISAQAEPEVLFQRHLAMLRWVREILDKHGGVIQHLHDDQMFVLFGLERTRRDDLDRALACATELQRRAPELERQGLPIAFAIGVHEGEVTVGQAGARTRYNARGNTTRLARRLSEQCDHGQVLVSDTVHRSMTASWSFQRGPWLLGRGGRSPDPTWALGPRRPLSHAVQPWLRREDELEVLQSSLHQVASGQGAIVVVDGEAGTGKSRLVGEVARLAERRGLRVLTARATPFGHPLAIAHDLLLDILGLEPEAGEEDVRVAVEQVPLLNANPRDRELANALLGLRHLRIEPDQAWQAIQGVLRALNPTDPVVMVLEDLHHLSDPVLEGLSRMVQGLLDSPVLQLLTCQGRCPDRLPDAQHIRLQPLPETLQIRMVSLLLGGVQVAPALAAQVHATCEGNPLYIQELVRFLQDRGHLQVEAGLAQLRGDALQGLPDTLSGLMASRLDALDPASKGAVQIAAVIGPTFRQDLLGDAIGLDDPSPLVDELAAQGLIRRTSARGVWTFSSEFVRRCALQTSLRVQRSDHHRLVAEALERRIGDDPHPDTLARLARHCGEGRRLLDAARYAYRAGLEAEANHQLEQARRMYQDGLRWLAQVDSTAGTWEARTQGEALLRLRLGRLHIRQGHTRKGIGSLRIALDAAEEGGLAEVAVRSHLALGWHHLDAGEAERAHAHLTEAWQGARAEGHLELELEVTEARAVWATATGRADEALAAWEEMRSRLPDEAPALHARTLFGLARVATHAGDTASASRHLESALIEARSSKDLRLSSRILESLGRLALWDDRREEARLRLTEALEVRQGLGYLRGVARALRHLAELQLVAGQPTHARSLLRRSLDSATEAGWRQGQLMAQTYLAVLEGEQGDPRAMERVSSITTQARDLKEREVVLVIEGLLARLQAHLGEQTSAVERLIQAGQEARQHHLDLVATWIERTREAVLNPSPAPWPPPPP